MPTKKPQKLKILYLITKSNWGGAQKYVYELATRIPKDKFEVVVALGGTGKRKAPTGKLHELLTKGNIRTIVITSLSREMYFIGDVRSFFSILNVLRKEKPDVVHLNSSKAGGLGSFAGRLLGIQKIIFTAHGLAIHEERFGGRTFRFLTWLTVLFATHTILITRRLARVFQINQYRCGSGAASAASRDTTLQLPRAPAG